MNRITELDGIRGLAALWIVAYHFSGTEWEWGWAGVDVFFVLSGYLITSIILRYGGAPGFLRSFYMRRGLRIWPIYYLLLAAVALLAPEYRYALPYYLTYTQETPHYLGLAMPKVVPIQHTWTLALEEQFYLAWPLAILFLNPLGVGVLAVLVAACSVWLRTSGTLHWWLLAARCDGFALGGLLASLAVGHPSRSAKLRLAAASALSFAVAAAMLVTGFSGRDRPIVVVLLAFAGVSLAILYSGGRLAAPLRLIPLVFLGQISYGIYLYHQPILQYDYAIKNRLGISGAPLIALDLFLVLAFAVGSWHFIEKPILGLKRHFEYRE